MKCTLLALAWGLTFLPLPEVHADILSLQSKEKKASFFSASDDAMMSIPGQAAPEFVDGFLVANPIYVPLTFTQFIHDQGKRIRSNGTEFYLDKGQYAISFTGTFRVSTQVEEFSSVFFNVGLMIGNDAFFINSESHDASDDSTGITSFTRVLKLNKPGKLSVVLNNTTPDSNVIATTRSITIQQLK